MRKMFGFEICEDFYKRHNEIWIVVVNLTHMKTLIAEFCCYHIMEYLLNYQNIITTRHSLINN